MTKKVCLLGAVAVGKTSLVRRFVQGIFSDRYLTTVGVRIDKKTVTVDGGAVTLILWDLAGEDEFAQLQTSYLKGASGCLFVGDGTRPNTLDQALELQRTAARVVGSVPSLFAVNKSDLRDEWCLPETRLEALRSRDGGVRPTSAKSGTGVDAIFSDLAALVIRS